jgi:uncharacterized protein (DUF1330 family)
MPAYAIAHLRTPTINEEVLEYIERIQSTLDPHGGRFLVHGAEVDVMEGDWPGTIVERHVLVLRLTRRSHGCTSMRSRAGGERVWPGAASK